MMIKYPKVHRLGKEETDGILLGECCIQEKIDGANASIWLENGEIHCASRNNELTEGFNGFVDYAKTHDGIQDILKDNPDFRLYGEWLVRHSVVYNETAYKKFYLFDILIDGGMDGERVTGEFLPSEDVINLADEYGIERPHVFETITNPSDEYLHSLAGHSQIGEKGEGVVIKNLGFRNRFGEMVYAKVVTQEFKEDNAIIFGGNNKFSDTYWEMYVINKYMTLPRVQKVMQKIQPTIDERLDMQHIPRITNSSFHDMMTEEIWEIVKKVPAIDFKKLKILANRKAKQIYVDILNNTISVADEVCEK
jgi:hypothetical protein